MKEPSREQLWHDEYVRRARVAYVVCDTCGFKHGRHDQVDAKFRMGTCDICKKRKGITDFKNYGFSIHP